MKVTMFQDGDQIELTSIEMNQDAKQRLLALGLYPGAIIQMEKVGRKGKPSLLLVCGNFLMLREKDLEKMEGVKIR